MLNSAVAPTIAALRVRIQRLEGATAQKCEALSFAIAEIGGKLPGGGLVIGALHEVAGGGADAVHGAAAALFVAGIVARTKGDILWRLTRPDLFAPALAQQASIMEAISEIFRCSQRASAGRRPPFRTRPGAHRYYREAHS